jgi:hypothetical protein
LRIVTKEIGRNSRDKKERKKEEKKPSNILG